MTAQDADGEHTVRLALEGGLLNALSSEDAARRAAAARAMGLIGHREALPYLAGMLYDPDTLVGDRVVEALATLGGVESLPMLQEALKSKDESVRARAAYRARSLRRRSFHSGVERDAEERWGHAGATRSGSAGGNWYTRGG